MKKSNSVDNLGYEWPYPRYFPLTLISRSDKFNFWSPVTGRWCGSMALPEKYEFSSNGWQSKNCQVTEKDICFGDYVGQVFLVNVLCRDIWEASTRLVNDEIKKKSEILCLSSSYSCFKDEYDENFTYQNLLLAGNGDGGVCVWDVNTSEFVHYFKNAHKDSVRDLLFLSEYEFASCSYDKTVRVYDLVKRKRTIMYKNHSNWVNNLGYMRSFFSSPILFSCSDDMTVNMYDQKEKKVIDQINFENCVCSLHASSKHHYLIAGNDEGDLFCTDFRKTSDFLWKNEKAHDQKILRIIGNSGVETVGDLDTGIPTNKRSRMALANSFITSSKDKHIKFFNIKNGKFLRKIKENNEIYGIFVFENPKFKPNKVKNYIKKLSGDVGASIKAGQATQKISASKSYDSYFFNPERMLIEEEILCFKKIREMFEKLSQVRNIVKIMEKVQRSCLTFINEQTYLVNKICSDLDFFFQKKQSDFDEIVRLISKIKPLDMLKSEIRDIIHNFVDISDLITILKYRYTSINDFGSLKFNLEDAEVEGSIKKKKKKEVYPIVYYFGEVDRKRNFPKSSNDKMNCYLVNNVAKNQYTLVYKGKINKHFQRFMFGREYDIRSGKLLYEGGFKDDWRQNNGVLYNFGRFNTIVGKFEKGEIAERTKELEFSVFNMNDFEKHFQLTKNTNFDNKFLTNDSRVNSSVCRVNYYELRLSLKQINFRHLKFLNSNLMNKNQVNLIAKTVNFLNNNKELQDKIHAILLRNYRFLNENIDHENIIKIYGIVTNKYATDESNFLFHKVGMIMKNINNGPFSLETNEKAPNNDFCQFNIELLKSLKLSEKLQILYDICDSMEYLHKKNITFNKNLELSNFLYDKKTGRTVLFDLDNVCSKKLNIKVWKNNLFVNKFSNSSYIFRDPYTFHKKMFSVLSSEKEPDYEDKKSDVYSFSLILYCVLFNVLNPYRNNLSCPKCGVDVLRINDYSSLMKHVNECNLKPDLRYQNKKYLKNLYCDNYVGDVGYYDNYEKKWFINLIKVCWDKNHCVRPSFTELKMFLESKIKLLTLQKSESVKKKVEGKRRVSTDDKDNTIQKIIPIFIKEFDEIKTFSKIVLVKKDFDLLMGKIKFIYNNTTENTFNIDKLFILKKNEANKFVQKGEVTKSNFPNYFQITKDLKILVTLKDDTSKRKLIENDELFASKSVNELKKVIREKEREIFSYKQKVENLVKNYDNLSKEKKVLDRVNKVVKDENTFLKSEIKGWEKDYDQWKVQIDDLTKVFEETMVENKELKMKLKGEKGGAVAKKKAPPVPKGKGKGKGKVKAPPIPSQKPKDKNKKN